MECEPQISLTASFLPSFLVDRTNSRSSWTGKSNSKSPLSHSSIHPFIFDSIFDLVVVVVVVVLFSSSPLLRNNNNNNNPLLLLLPISEAQRKWRISRSRGSSRKRRRRSLSVQFSQYVAFVCLSACLPDYRQLNSILGEEEEGWVRQRKGRGKHTAKLFLFSLVVVCSAVSSPLLCLRIIEPSFNSLSF